MQAGFFLWGLPARPPNNSTEIPVLCDVRVTAVHRSLMRRMEVSDRQFVTKKRLGNPDRTKMHKSLCVNDLHSTGKMDKQALKPRISNIWCDNGAIKKTFYRTALLGKKSA